jgi:hypothetical protein
MGGKHDIVLPTSMGFNQQPWELVVTVGFLKPTSYGMNHLAERR